MGMELEIADSCTETDFAIAGLRFEPNHVLHMDTGASTPELKVISNRGGVVGHFVTHAEDFAYRDYGLHAGQIDRLTFVAPIGRRVVAELVDCREGSPTLGRKLRLAFSVLPNRQLVIPSGVAHTFENFAGVVTRNDLELYCDPTNPDWRIAVDNTTFPIDTAPEERPVIRTNHLPLPFPAAVMFYRMQQNLLRGGRDEIEHSVDTRIAGAPQRLVATRGWINPPVRVDIDREFPIDGFGFGPNSYFAGARDSYGVLPTLPNCVMDLVTMELDGVERPYALHVRDEVLHTFLDRTGEPVAIELIDLRRDSETFGRHHRVLFACEPRAHVRIPAGVAYRYRGQGGFAVRIEYRLFLDENEPRYDLPPVGADYIAVREMDRVARIGVVPPTVEAPAEVIWFMLRKELEMLGAASVAAPLASAS